MKIVCDKASYQHTRRLNPEFSISTEIHATYTDKKSKFLFFFPANGKMSALKVEQISAPAILGEGPHWDHNAQALYYVDILGHTIHKYVPAINKHTTVKIGMYYQIIETYYVTKQKFK
jgi:hypothetical protein